MVRRVVAFIAFAAVLCSCGGGGVSVAPATSGPAGPRAPASLTFVIRVPSGSSPAAARRRPAYVSPSTQSLTISNAGTVIVTANLTPQSPGCTAPTGSTPLTCTVSATVPSGTNTLTIATYDQPGATGTKVAVAALQVTAAPSGPTTINLTLSGIVASLALALDPATLPSGTAADTAIILNALDPDGNVIVGPQPFADASGNALTVTLSDSDVSGATTLPAQHTFTAPTGDVTLHYTGGALASATITASAPGVTSKNATLTIGGTSALVTEFRSGISANSGPAGAALGPDGNVWFTETAGDRVGRITPHGKVTEFSAGMTPFSSAAGITAGPDGNMWFAEGAGRIGRITMSGAITEFSTGIPAGTKPASIAAGADGNLWFTDEAHPAVGRITTSGAVTMFTTGITYSAVAAFLGPCSMAKGPNGNVWWLEQDISSGNPPKIAQITPAGAVTEYALTQTFVSGVAPGPDGNVWFTEGSDVARITPSGTITRFTGNDTNGCIAAGPDGNLWFSGTFFDEIGKVTPSGTLTLYPQPPPGSGYGITAGSEPLGIAPGSDGNVWFTENLIPGVGRVNVR